MKKYLSSISGFLSGIINGLLGAGGGMIIVPMLLKCGLSRQKAHATSVCIILPICVFSAVLYLYSGRVSIKDTLPYLLWGVIGSLIGAWILPKIKQNILKKAFALLMIWAGIRMVLK